MSFFSHVIFVQKTSVQAKVGGPTCKTTKRKPNLSIEIPVNQFEKQIVTPTQNVAVTPSGKNLQVSRKILNNMTNFLC